MGQPQIHVLLDEPEMPPAIAAALQRVGAGIRLSRLESELETPSPAQADARLVVTSPSNEAGSARWQALLKHCHQHPCATLVLTPEPIDALGVPGAANSGPIGFANDLSADELAGRLTAMCTLHRSYAQMQEELVELRHRNRTRAVDANDFDEQMRLASQIQRDMLPDPPPIIPGAILHALYRPAQHVSGDIYDVTHLDEEHVALSLADATGHGLPAALLTMLIKRTLRGKQVFNGSYRLLAPDMLLAQLNDELLEANLSHCQFVTALYAVYDHKTRVLCWARGGAPHPILIRPGQPTRMLTSAGPLLGAVEGAQFDRIETQLESGDVVILRTDGLDNLLLNENGQRIHDTIEETTWYQELGSLPPVEHLTDLADLLDVTPPSDWPVDDLTVLALHIE
ncbi:MAG: PP2C family protein-serine/threonine phosphatase [Phycisphaerae bacterium]